MALPKIHQLTDTDVKILLNLVRPKTLEELVTASGMSFTYAQRRLRTLKARKFIEVIDKTGQAFIYQTRKLPETEPLFVIRDNTETQTTSNVYRIPYFYGKNPTLNEAYNLIVDINHKNKLDHTLMKVIRWSLAVIKVRSHRKATGEQFSQHPTEERMREELGKYILKTERELALAKHLYDTKFLWSGHENIWRILSDNEPTEGVITVYKEAGKAVG